MLDRTVVVNGMNGARTLGCLRPMPSISGVPVVSLCSCMISLGWQLSEFERKNVLRNRLLWGLNGVVSWMMVMLVLVGLEMGFLRWVVVLGAMFLAHIPSLGVSGRTLGRFPDRSRGCFLEIGLPVSSMTDLVRVWRFLVWNFLPLMMVLVVLLLMKGLLKSLSENPMSSRWCMEVLRCLMAMWFLLRVRMMSLGYDLLLNRLVLVLRTPMICLQWDSRLMLRVWVGSGPLNVMVLAIRF